MEELEKGAVANPDENRMVGHYWLRNPELAPTPEIRNEIIDTLRKTLTFADNIHSGKISGPNGHFKKLLIIGIGGSALGPQFLSSALGDPLTDKMEVFFFDNTDPDGMDKVLAALHGELDKTLCLVISKSGGTKETRNGMLEARNAFSLAGLDFAKQSVAITGQNSELDLYAMSQGWIVRFPMWDWVGGRTSVLSAVGLLPAALQGINVNLILNGAKCCDIVTRSNNVNDNPSAMLALMWFYSGAGHGSRAMVVLPYKDRLELFSKYLQQLIMESLGKEKDLDGRLVNQGLSVFGNKGSTDQHAYIQQLREGLNNFFALFIQIEKDRKNDSLEVEDSANSGDFLNGFFLGTRQALFENNRESITLILKEVSPFSVGVLIALFERAVGFYATLINVNAYHQPGVEAGKKAAESILHLQRAILSHLKSTKLALTVDELARDLNAPDDIEHIFKICEHLAINRHPAFCREPENSPFEARYLLG